MASGSKEEEKNVLLAIAGSDAAFKELVLSRQAWLRSLLRRLSGDDALADDLSQETLLRAWRNIGSLDNHKAFASWLRSIALRCWVDHARRHKLSFKDVDPDLSASNALAGGVETADHRLDIHAAVAKLPPGPRACVVLFYGEGMSHAEVARATGLNVGVVKSHIARSTKRLRNSLQDWKPQ